MTPGNIYYSLFSLSRDGDLGSKIWQVTLGPPIVCQQLGSVRLARLKGIHQLGMPSKQKQPVQSTATSN